MAQQWKIGDVTVTKLIEREENWDGTQLLPNATPENMKKEADWLGPLVAADGTINLSIHTLVIESKGKKIVVDTCVGNDKKRDAFPQWTGLQSPFLQTLEQAGCTRDGVDHVICTHLHLDHVGWNTMLENGHWVPTFRNAQYLFGGTEWDYFSKMEDDFHKGPVDDSVRPVISDGLAELIDWNHKVNDEVWLEPTPGHTPGHMSVRISSKGQNAVITGDMIHHPVQCKYPEWDDNFDADGPMAKKTRREFCERYADTGTLVIGTHFAGPTAGKISKSGDSFRFTVA